ncbi:Gag-pro-like protein [Gossypium australe]|uniref:Gag-pro-like protein n=1 Tax=Gossypium australe TaxID=47621 RepID=A0A5B6WQF7_9ROSI|nr:Gag-pro-like protein [Gossypium australe]
MTKMDRARVELQKQLEDQCKWLEEKFRAMENANYLCRVDAKDLSLVLNLVLPPKLKSPEFKQYNGTSCPEAHITIFYRRMTGYANNDPLLIHYFQDSLIGSVTKWYNQLSHAKINSWKDLAQAFMKQYSHMTDMTPDRITLQNMEKKQSKSFRQYTQRWREVAMQVQPYFLEKGTTMLFINTLEAPFINHMLGSATKSFLYIVMYGEMIEKAVRSGKIDAGENAKRSTPRKKKNEVNNASMYNKGYSKSVTVGQPRTVTTSHQGSSRHESNSRPNIEKLQFTPTPMTYKLYQHLFDAHVVSPFYFKPMQPSFPKWSDPKERGATMSSTLKKVVRSKSALDSELWCKDVGFYTRNERCYEPTNPRVEPIKGKSLVTEQKKKKTTRPESPIKEPVTENEAKEFLKLLKHSEYSVVEQLHKQPTRISVLALLLSLETHRSVLMKLLNETYVADDIFVNKLDRLVNNISVNNFIFFNDDEIPSEGMGSTKALYITTRCK